MKPIFALAALLSLLAVPLAAQHRDPYRWPPEPRYVAPPPPPTYTHPPQPNPFIFTPSPYMPVQPATTICNNIGGTLFCSTF